MTTSGNATASKTAAKRQPNRRTMTPPRSESSQGWVIDSFARRFIHRLVLEHIEAVLRAQASDLAEAQARLAELDRQSDKLLEAHYAD